MRTTKDRLRRMLIPETIFESMGFTYLGPTDGHDLPGLINLLTAAKEMREPVVIHVVTKKGCGYRFAEEDPAKFHGIGFNITVPHVTPHLFFPQLDLLVLVQYAYDDEPLCDEYGQPIPPRYTLVEYQGLYPMM